MPHPIALLVVDGAQHVDGGVPAPSVVDRFQPVHRRRAGTRARRPGRRLDQLTLGLAPDARRLVTALTFGQARRNFYEAARRGLDAELLSARACASVPASRCEPPR